MNLQFDSDLQLFQKIEYLTLKNKGKGVKKMVPDIIGVGDENVSKTYMKWVIDEYFYSYIDKPYFQFNEFDGILRKSNLKSEQSLMKRSEWNKLRAAFGKPRRFSRNFVNTELERLNLFRDRVRKWMSRKKLINDGAFSTELTKRIQSIQPLQVVSLFILKNNKNRGKLSWQFTHKNCICILDQF